MPRKLRDQVIVVTGASSGIGRETAIEAGRRGARLVLAARNQQALDDVVRRIEHAGGQAHAVVADVAEPEQVQRLADEAVRRFGRIDTWVNNAAISIYGTIDQLQPEELDRVIRVNLLGVMYGCRAAVLQMKRPRDAGGGGGTIINVGSALSDRAVPLASIYVASKFAVRGFTDALRMDLSREAPDIHVTLVLPASINTPLFSHARSRLGVKPRPIPPVYEPRVVADAILHAAEHPTRDIYAGDAGKALAIMERISPRLTDWWMLQGGRMFRKQKSTAPGNARDNLFQPMEGAGQSTGEWSDESFAASPYTRQVEMHPMRKPFLLGAAAVGALWLVRRLVR
jgi:short-subunit dehydrogenase